MLVCEEIVALQQWTSETLCSLLEHWTCWLITNTDESVWSSDEGTKLWDYQLQVNNKIASKWFTVIY